MTGAPVPDGADTVVMVEHTERTGDTVTVNRPVGKSNIRAQGEELKAGDTVLTAGTRISPVETAVLATVGCDPVPVAVRPRVGVIATGDELVEPSAIPGAAHIRNSNSYQLCAQVEAAGCVPTYCGIAKDTPQATADMLGRALAESDVVMLSGGVSMGEHDFVPGGLKDLGVELLFEKVAVQPGKPTVFGIVDDKRVFGMPGNPVSTYVLFELLVRPFLCRMMGGEYRQRRVQAALSETMKRRKADRLSFRPVTLGTDGTVSPVKYHGSAHMHAYVHADGLVAFDTGATEIAEGTMVGVVLLNG
jgi:molybdopterin molybdotransferase